MLARLRAAVSADVPAMVDIQHAGALCSLTHIFPQDAYPFPRVAIESRWLSEVADPDVTVYVIEYDDGRGVGFAAVRGNELLHFGTAVETWGSGLAAAAHDLLIDEIRAAPPASVSVTDRGPTANLAWSEWTSTSPALDRCGTLTGLIIR